MNEKHSNIRNSFEVCGKSFKKQGNLKKPVQNIHINTKPESMSRGEEKVKKWLEENEN